MVQTGCSINAVLFFSSSPLLLKPKKGQLAKELKFRRLGYPTKVLDRGLFVA
jgi:hypothetical protein